MNANPAEWHALRVTHLETEIRNLYWHIRNSVRGRDDAYRRRYYRRIAAHKAELLKLGRTHRQMLDFLALCRSGRKLWR